MNLEIDDEYLKDIQFVLRSLIFNAGKGVNMDQLKKIFEDDFPNLIEKLKNIFLLFGIDLRINTIDKKLFIVPFNDFFHQVEEYNIRKNFQVLSKKQKDILSRFLTIFISNGKDEPISKEKLRIDLKDKFGVEYTNKDLKQLHKLGYVNIIANRFIDIGWRLRNSPEFKLFTQKFLQIVEKKESEIKNESNN